MPNPRGVNQYSKGGGGGRKASPKTAKSIAAAQRSRSGPGRVQLAPGTSAAAHTAFVAQQLAAKAARSKKSKSKRR